MVQFNRVELGSVFGTVNKNRGVGFKIKRRQALLRDFFFFNFFPMNYCPRII